MIIGVIASSAKGAPGIPTIGTATDVGTARPYNNGSASVTFTAGAGAAATSYTVKAYTTANVYTGFSTTGASSPLVVTGLSSSTQYKYTVLATNASGSSLESGYSNTVTATTVPQAPTIGTATCAAGQAYTGSASISVPFTAGATGGQTISGYTVTSSSTNTGSGASSPISVSETVGNPTSTARTYTVTATNVNGTSTASSASNSIAAVSVPQTPTIGTATRTGNTTVSQTYTANATGGSAITSVTATSSPSISLSTSGTSSPVTITGTFVQGTAYTFTITQTNAFGTSSASGSSNSVTPYPAPVLGAWSSGAAYTQSSTNFNRVGAASSNTVYVGTGITASGDNTSGAGSYFNGTSWTNNNYPDNLYVPSMFNYDVSTTMLGVGGTNFNFNYTSTYYRTSGAWITGVTAAPVAQNSAAGARVSDGFIMTPGESGGTTSYSFVFTTTPAGTWTARATYPIGSGNRCGTHEGNGQTMYTIENNSSSSYKISSITGAFSASTTSPTGGANQNPQGFFKFIGNNNRMFYHANTASGGSLSNYLFDGTTFTASTSFPAGATNAWAGGAIGNTISAVNSSTATTTTHYLATLA
jgi:trimeric autotransporter adhesin